MSLSAKSPPPYVSYRTFWNFLDSLRQAMPARIDRSYWGDKLSGSTGGQLVSALRYLKLVDFNNVPTLRLKQIIFAKDQQRINLLQQLHAEAYGLFAESGFDPASATYAQLQEIIEQRFQISSEVARKCIKFYLGLSSEAGISLSPFVMKKTRAMRLTSPVKKVRKNGLKTTDTPPIPLPEPEPISIQRGGLSVEHVLLNKFPAFDPAWSEELKLKWFSAFDELLKKQRV